MGGRPERGRQCANSVLVKNFAHLLEEPSLLDDIGNSLHLDAFCLVDILESVEISCLFVLDDSNLQTVVDMRIHDRRYL